jgi:hypothetical protein
VSSYDCQLLIFIFLDFSYDAGNLGIMSTKKQRAEGQVTLTVSLPAELKEAWQQEADRQRRNKSNLFVLVAEQYLSGRLQEVPDDQGKIIDRSDPNAGGANTPTSYRQPRAQ